MLKALPLVHFWSILLLKEQMMTSVRKTFKTLVWSAQNRLISSEICLENNHKMGRFLPIAFWWSLPRKLPRNSRKIGRFSANLSLKIPRNLTFSSATYQTPWYYNRWLLSWVNLIIFDDWLKNLTWFPTQSRTQPSEELQYLITLIDQWFKWQLKTNLMDRHTGNFHFQA